MDDEFLLPQSRFKSNHRAVVVLRESDYSITPINVLPSSSPSSSSSSSWKPKSIVHVAIRFIERDRHPWLGTLCLLTYIGVWVTSTLCIPLAILLLCLQYWLYGGILALAIFCCYLPYKPSPFLRRLARENFGRYFQEASVQFEYVPQPELDRPTILCINPHGVFSLSWAHCYITEELSHIVFCFSAMLRLNPFLRLVTDFLGHPSSISKSAVQTHMRDGRSIAIIPGAWHEATLHCSKVDRLFIRKRRGFVKYALRFGYTLTPTYCFGERETYSNIQGGYACRFWLNDRRVLALIPWGVWWCPILPRPAKLHTVVGVPIELPHIPKPTDEDVNKWHTVYIREMVELYDRYKGVFYGKEGETQILELW